MSNLNIVTVIQARMGSTRLPGKALLPLEGKPLLLRMAERVMLSPKAGQVVVATSVNPLDDEIEKVCGENNLECFRGSENDLLERHYFAGKKYDADAVVKIPSDCPLIDPQIIDKVLSYFKDAFPEYDYVSNLHPASYPDGNDVEIMKMESLEKAYKNAVRKLEREHTTPYIWENPGMFKLGNVKWETGEDLSTELRWTIDYEEDYKFIETVYEELYPENPAFLMKDIMDLLERKPYIKEINKKHAGEYWYKNHLNELNNIGQYKSKMKRSYE